MYLDIGKFLLETFKEVRSVISLGKDRKQDLVALGTFLELYGSATRLDGYLQRLHAPNEDECYFSLEASEGILSRLLEEVYRFGMILKDLNLCAIEIVHADLAEELARVRVIDGDLLGYVEHVLADKYNLDAKNLPEAVKLLKGCDGDAWYPFRELKHANPKWFRHSDWYRQWGDLPSTEKHINSIICSLSATVAECRQLIAQTIREHWDAKDLLVSSVKH